MFRRNYARIVSALCLTFSVATLLAAMPSGDWPTFRGPGRTAVSQETDLLQEWPVGGPPLAWESRGTGRGYSSLAIAGGRIYTLGDGITPADDTDEYLLCLDAKDGKLIWKTKMGPAWNKGQQSDWQSSRSTPTIDGNFVYSLTAEGQLVCCETGSGEEQWRKSLAKDFAGKKADGWGYSESVLIDGEQLVCTPGGEKMTMVALNKRTGEMIWSTVREGDRGAGHASIVISEIGGTRVYVQTTGSGALGVRANDGKLLWSYEIEKTIAVIPTPIVKGDLVFFTAGYKRGGALLKQVPAPNSEVQVEEIYPINPELANKHGGIVLVGDYLYGDSDSAGIPFCAELATGNVVWKKRGSGKKSAAFAAADGRLYIHFEDGTVVLAKAQPEEYVEVGSFKAPYSGERPSWAHPIIVGGKLFIREQDAILCYDVRERAGAAAAGSQ